MDTDVHVPHGATAGTVTATARVDTAGIEQTINRALSIGTVLPRHQMLEDLEAALRGHLATLLEAVPTAGPARTATAFAQLHHGPTTGLCSAVDHTRLLALDCRWLLRHLQSADRIEAAR